MASTITNYDDLKAAVEGASLDINSPTEISLAGYSDDEYPLTSYIRNILSIGIKESSDDTSTKGGYVSITDWPAIGNDEGLFSKFTLDGEIPNLVKMSFSGAGISWPYNDTKNTIAENFFTTPKNLKKISGINTDSLCPNGETSGEPGYSIIDFNNTMYGFAENVLLKLSGTYIELDSERGDSSSIYKQRWLKAIEVGRKSIINVLESNPTLTEYRKNGAEKYVFGKITYDITEGYEFDYKNWIVKTYSSFEEGTPEALRGVTDSSSASVKFAIKEEETETETIVPITLDNFKSLLTAGDAPSYDYPKQRLDFSNVVVNLTDSQTAVTIDGNSGSLSHTQADWHTYAFPKFVNCNKLTIKNFPTLESVPEVEFAEGATVKEIYIENCNIKTFPRIAQCKANKITIKNSYDLGAVVIYPDSEATSVENEFTNTLTNINFSYDKTETETDPEVIKFKRWFNTSKADLKYFKGTTLEDAFSGCSHLSNTDSVILPDENIAIMKNAFKGCTNLKNISLKYTNCDYTSAFENCGSSLAVSIGMNLSNFISGNTYTDIFKDTNVSSITYKASNENIDPYTKVINGENVVATYDSALQEIPEENWQRGKTALIIKTGDKYYLQNQATSAETKNYLKLENGKFFTSDGYEYDGAGNFKKIITHNISDIVYANEKYYTVNSLDGTVSSSSDISIERPLWDLRPNVTGMAANSKISFVKDEEFVYCSPSKPYLLDLEADTSNKLQNDSNYPRKYKDKFYEMVDGERHILYNHDHEINGTSVYRPNKDSYVIDPQNVLYEYLKSSFMALLEVDQNYIILNELALFKLDKENKPTDVLGTKRFWDNYGKHLTTLKNRIINGEIKSDTKTYFNGKSQNSEAYSLFYNCLILSEEGITNYDYVEYLKKYREKSITEDISDPIIIDVGVTNEINHYDNVYLDKTLGTANFVGIEVDNSDQSTANTIYEESRTNHLIMDREIDVSMNSEEGIICKIVKNENGTFLIPQEGIEFGEELEYITVDYPYSKFGLRNILSKSTVGTTTIKTGYPAKLPETLEFNSSSNVSGLIIVCVKTDLPKPVWFDDIVFTNSTSSNIIPGQDVVSDEEELRNEYSVEGLIIATEKKAVANLKSILMKADHTVEGLETEKHSEDNSI